MAKTVSYTRHTKTYQFSGFLTLHPQDGMKLTAREPNAAPGSRVAKIQLEVPLSFFAIPSLVLTAKVPQGQGGEIKINADAAAEALRPVLGGDIKLEFTNPETE